MSLLQSARRHKGRPQPGDQGLLSHSRPNGGADKFQTNSNSCDSHFRPKDRIQRLAGSQRPQTNAPKSKRDRAQCRAGQGTGHLGDSRSAGRRTRRMQGRERLACCGKTCLSQIRQQFCEIVVSDGRGKDPFGKCPDVGSDGSGSSPST